MEAAAAAAPISGQALTEPLHLTNHPYFDDNIKKHKQASMNRNCLPEPFGVTALPRRDDR
jgi:hypothetical protein